MSFALLESSSFPTFSIIATAAAGGCIVFIGLAIEKFADWLNDKYIGGDDKPHKGLGLFGWWLLMLGIAVEIGVAISSAIEVRDISKLAMKNAPINQPIRRLTAYAQVEVIPLSNINVKNSGLIRVVGATNVHLSSPSFSTNALGWVSLEIGTNGQSESKFSLSKSGWIGSICLSAHQGESDRIRFDIFFDKNDEVSNPESLTVAQLNVARLIGSGENFGFPAIVACGRIELTCNGFILKTFGIPPQTNKHAAVTSVESNGVFMPYRSILTNVK
jgi:hypothetical protein